MTTYGRPLMALIAEVEAAGVQLRISDRGTVWMEGLTDTFPLALLHRRIGRLGLSEITVQTGRVLVASTKRQLKAIRRQPASPGFAPMPPDAE